MGSSLQDVRLYFEKGEVSEETDKIIDELLQKCQTDAHLRGKIEASLGDALANAKAQGMDEGLMRRLPWPQGLKEYEAYLHKFARYVPYDTEDVAVESHTYTCHFYWLVNQPPSDADSKHDEEERDDDRQKELQREDWFSGWLVRFIQCWGNFLDTTDSFTPEVLKHIQQQRPDYHVEDSMIEDPMTKHRIPNAPSGWLTYNQFFARHLNPGRRPIKDPTDNRVVVRPADCTYQACYDIEDDGAIPQIELKGTHRFANVAHLLEGSAYSEAFHGGLFVHFYLAPNNYHRYHTPVAGEVKESYHVDGLAYLNVLINDGKYNSPDKSEGGYEFRQQRGVLIIDTTNSKAGDIGLVGVVPVGMSQVSSVTMTADAGHEVAKGEEFGYFLYGGSDIILLFQRRNKPTWVDKTERCGHYGTEVALCDTLTKAAAAKKVT